jgi:hypothetical protein
MAIWLAAGAQVVVGYLTFGLASEVDPIHDPVSDYVFYGAGQPLFILAVLLVLTGGGALATAAHLAGLPRTGWVTVLFGLWSGGLLMVIVFRGNTSADEPTLHGELHRLGGAVLFSSLPLACWTLARALRARPRWASAATPLRWCAAAGLVTAAAFGLAQVVPALPQGLLERIALSAELLILVTAAIVTRRAAR